MKHSHYNMLSFTALIASGMIAFHAEAMQPVNQTMPQSGTIQYVTGGIGQEERQAMESVRSQYNFRLMSTNDEGGLVGDTPITIRNQSGATVISAVAGPLFYAQLPAGKYTLEAASEGIVKNQTFTIGKTSKPSTIHLSWKADPGDQVTSKFSASY